MLANKDIRMAALCADIRLWWVAKRLGIAEATFSRKLRFELPDEEKAKVFQAIKDISREQEG